MGTGRLSPIAYKASGAPLVQCFWEQKIVGGQHLQLVVPDGCADIMVDPTRILAEQIWTGVMPEWLVNKTVEPLVQTVMRSLASPDHVPLAVLVDQIGLSTKQIRRLVIDNAGLEPRLVRRVLRLQRLLHTSTEEPSAIRAAVAGFADQAHMAREVRALTGTTPTRLLGAP